MAQSIVKLTGIASWARLYDFNKDTHFDEDGVFQVNMNLDKDNVAKMKAAGIRNKPKINEETGEIHYVFRRKNAVTWKGVKQLIGPPPVTFEGKPFEELIGNGSKLELTLEVYDTMKGKGSRIKEVKVLDWVKYEREDASDDAVDDDIPF